MTVAAFFLDLALGGWNLVKGVWSALGRFLGALNGQGAVGLVAALLLAFLWLHAASDARHWKKQSDQFEKLYRAEQAAHQQTIANYRAAADKARAADAANKARVEAEQAAITERTNDAYQIRIADARATAERLRGELAKAAADPGSRGSAAVPGLSTPAGGTAQAACDGLPLAEKLTATEQAIQLDELINWTLAQHAVDVNGKP